MARASKVLIPTAVKAQEALRTNRLVSARVTIDSVFDSIKAAETAEKAAATALEAAHTERLHKTEAAYIALAAVSAEHKLSLDECRDLITAAIKTAYPKLKDNSVAKLRSEFVGAMSPNVRGGLKSIIEPWSQAYNDEEVAKEANPEAATPMRDKFTSRHNAITQAIRLANGKTAKMNKKGDKVLEPAVPGERAGSVDTVLAWVAAHPRVKKAPAQPSGEPVVSENDSPKDQAESRVSQLITAVERVQAHYPDTGDCFEAVKTALRACTAAKLCRAVTSAAPPATPPAAPPPAEPVQGAADLDDAIGEPIAALRERVALMREMKELSGK